MDSSSSIVRPGEEIVVTGISGKFPDSNDVYHFRDNLYNKVDLVSDDCRRWKPIHPEIPQRTGKIFGVDKFDAGFFGVPQNHVDNMDPMIRMNLEKVYEALMDAGYHPSELEGTATGVYVGACSSETESYVIHNDTSNSDSIASNDRSMVAKRISYFFKFSGTAFITDTGCSSSMFALEHAYKHMKEGICERAVICGTNLCLHPFVSLQFARLGVLGPDGACRSFDNTGTGYVRSEAIVALILEKAKDARRIYAEIVHSKTNSDGFKENGMTFPSSEMQKLLMEQCYAECKVDPTALTFVEAHGTGTKAGDTEELTALDEFFCKGRKRPLHIGAVKSNIGHSEPVSGLCSIVKILIGFETGFIPPNINYFNPREGIEALEQGRLIAVTEKMPWPDQNGLVGISNFGFGGANGHALLRWNRKLKINGGIPNDNLPRLVCASGRSKATVTSIFDTASNMDAEFINLIHKIFGKVMSNSLFNGYLISSKQGEVEKVIGGNMKTGNVLRIVFGNSDQKWYLLWERLMEIPVFSDTIKVIQEILYEDLHLNILDILISNEENAITNGKFGTVIVQLAVANLMKTLGLDIYETTGIGYGELAAAFLDDSLPLRKVLLIAYHIVFANTSKRTDILASKILKTSRWLSACNVDKCNHFNSQRCSERLLENFSKRLRGKQQNKGRAKKNTINLMIGSKNEIKLTEKDVLLVGNHGSEPIVELLRSFGRLFLLGFPCQLDKLYPTVTYPVSRGTPMVSPLIKWNHSESYAVHLYKNEEEIKKGQRVVHVSVSMEDWNFITGHIVDGRNLFPAAGYIALVWEFYAIILGKLKADASIVFEDVKFLRALTVPPADTLILKVIIQVKSERFEIIENGAVLVTGRVYPMNSEHKLVNISSIDLQGKDEFTMSESDVYKELRLRGYHYANQFRTIKKCNIEGNRALISWNGNWITFMDSMLQVKLLSEDTRDLYVPTSIKRMIIDRTKQTKNAVDCNDLISVTYRKDIGIITGGGIEIIGLGARVISRKKPAEPLLESYKFVPNRCKLQQHQAMRCIVQTVLENTDVTKVKSVEVLNDVDDVEDEPIMPLVQQSLEDIPLIQADLRILSKKANLRCGPGIVIENKKLNTESACTIVIARDILENPELLSVALRVTRDVSGFIITKECRGIPCEITSKIQILSSYETEEGHLLLIKETSRYIERVPVHIPSTQGDLSWLELLKQVMSKRIVLYCQNVTANGMLGLVNCLRKESSGNNVSTVVIMDDAPRFDIDNPFFKRQLENNLAFNVFKDGQWGSYRYLPLTDAQIVKKEHCYATVTTTGDLSSLRWIEGALSKETVPEPKTELVDVHYSAINFKDVMIASGKLSVDAATRNSIVRECVYGFEFSGKLTGDPSKRVMGMVTSGALSSMVTADSKLLWAVPDDWTLEDAATVPIAYGTVLYAFITRGRMQRGQSVLVHSGAGGVGQAAINVASHLGCTIFTTVGTREKREFIKKHFPQINPDHIGDSRSTFFEQMVLKQTNGKGVDFVLNSLAEEKLRASVRCLAKKGTFLEIGKFDVAQDNHLVTTLLKKQAKYEGIMLDDIFAGCDGPKEILSRLLKEGIRNGSVKPLIRSVFEHEKIEEAFRYMANGEHIGKVLVKIRNQNHTKQFRTFKGIPRISCTRSACYVVLGGMGGLGLELADWLVKRGAKHLVLTSRTGIKDGYQSYRLNIFKSYDAKVFVRNDDIGSEEGCKALLAFAEGLGPVEGIFNLAGILKDNLFENQTAESFNASLTPKAYATQHLDSVSRNLCPNLRHFVVFSSVFCGRGNAGQSNYGMANSVMERICEKRKKDGYPALAIQWGPIADVGLVARMQGNHKELVIGGILQQRASNCFQVLDRLLRQDEPVVSNIVLAEKKVGSGANNMFDAVLRIIGIINTKVVSYHTTFPELGMDSIMAVEVKQTLEREYEIFLTAQDIRNMTIAKLKDLVLK